MLRDPSEAYAAYPDRVAYLIDPTGVIRVSYEVADVVAFADTVLANVKELQA